uniref:Uncharacterized protein n=1 Tax=Timema bartmani TaxID=61472 RepID=A0A7R9FA80_9NEOP|nr:unnamed protein product [Timema bartmani]
MDAGKGVQLKIDILQVIHFIVLVWQQVTQATIQNYFVKCVRVKKNEGSGELTEYSEFVKVPPQQSWASWTLSLLVKSPLLWSMQKMKDALISPTFAMESKYVHLGAAKVQKVVMESMVGLGLDWARGTWFRDSFPGLVELGAPGA